MTSALFIGGSQPASSLPVESACGTLSGAGTVDTSSPTIAAASAADCAALAALAADSLAFVVAIPACVVAVAALELALAALALASAALVIAVCAAGAALATSIISALNCGTIVLKDSPHAFSAGLNASARSRNTVSVSVAVFGGIGRTGSVVIAIISSPLFP